MTITNVAMDWTDTGAVVDASVAVCCPRCSVVVFPGVQHRCGDKAFGTTAGSLFKVLVAVSPKKKEH